MPVLGIDLLQGEAVVLYHVNFHTLRNMPIFEQVPYDRMTRECLPEVLRRHKVVCLAWEIMPTHIHMIIEDFPDFPRPTILKYVKGSTSHAFFAKYPGLRGDLLGGHLWTAGYYFVAIRTHRQLLSTLNYVRTNRTQSDLSPPEPLEASQQ